MNSGAVKELFPSDLLTAIDRLSLDLRPAPPSTAAGAHLSRSAGASMDFRDFRPYAPGDDLRRLDWNVYRRTGHLFLRRFENPTTVSVRVLVDNSESMFVESPSRFAAAARMAAAVAAAALRSQDTVSLSVFNPEGGTAPIRNVTGRRHLHSVLSHLASAVPQRTATLGDAVSLMSRVVRGAGLVVVISDFFDPAGIESAMSGIQRAASWGGNAVNVQITQPHDAEPELVEDMELVDCESGTTATVRPSPAARNGYMAAYNSYQNQLESFSSARGIPVVRIDAASDIVPQLSRLFPSGVLRAGGGRL